MNIWIDLANSPHVLFFKPIINILISRNHNIYITLRDFSQTVELAKIYGIDGTELGKHGGKQTLIKLFNLMNRSLQLINYSKGKKIDLAVSHNSYTHTIAGRLINSRVVTLMDYEGQPANHIAFRFAHKVIVPDFFPDKDLKRFGAHPRKVYKYRGFKEQVYLSDFKPNRLILTQIIKACDLPIDWKIKQNILVTVRTPATTAAYHHFGNPLFDSLMKKLNQTKDLTVIVLPRTFKQKLLIKSKYPNLLIPKNPLFGSDLIYFSDFVISAGGTMNREAGILGTPVYTIFAGKLPSADSKLIEMGRLMNLTSENDIKKILFEKKSENVILKNPNLRSEICNEIIH